MPTAAAPTTKKRGQAVSHLFNLNLSSVGQLIDMEWENPTGESQHKTSFWLKSGPFYLNLK